MGVGQDGEAAVTQRVLMIGAMLRDTIFSLLWAENFISLIIGPYHKWNARSRW